MPAPNFFEALPQKNNPLPSTSLDGRRANFLKANPRNASRRSSGDKQASSYPSPLSHNEREGLGSEVDP